MSGPLWSARGVGYRERGGRPFGRRPRLRAVDIRGRQLESSDLRRLQDLGHAVWRHDSTRLNFETSFGTLAWQGDGAGRSRVFERGEELVGWARLTTSYDRIRQMGVWDVAPPSLV